MHFVNVNKVQTKLWLWPCFCLILTMAHAHAHDSKEPQSQSSPRSGKAGGHDPATGTLLYYGWFFDAPIATSLKNLYADHLKKLYTDVAAVKSFLDALSGANNVTQPLEYFTKPTDPATGQIDPYFHTTAMYCGDGIDCTAYTDRVKPFLDKPTQMHLIGAFFTERTFGVRVLLTKDQQELMNEDTKSADTGRLSGHAAAGANRASWSDYPGLIFEDQDRDYRPSQSKAHITLGCAPGIPAHITGPDLLGIVAYEAAAQPGNNYKEYALEGLGVLRHYNPDGPSNTTAFALYPNQKVLAPAKFEDYFMPKDPPGNGAAPTPLDVFTLSQRISVALLVLWILHGIFNS